MHQSKKDMLLHNFDSILPMQKHLPIDHLQKNLLHDRETNGADYQALITEVAQIKYK